jgi:uncharacterized protein YhfF
MTARAEAFWGDYLGTLPAGHPHRRARPDVFAFGDSAALADELAGLVEGGWKRATTTLPAEFAADGSAVPVAGDLSIVTRADGTPVAIIEIVAVQEIPFAAVDAAYAAEEGEGDGSLAWWRAAHRDYFGRVAARLGATFDERTPVVCQRFRHVWPHSTGSV